MLCHIIWAQAEEYKENKKLIPKGIKDNYEKIRLLNKDIKIRTWSNNELLNLIKTDFREYMEDYKKINDRRFISDLGRLFILYKYGGIYIDIDQECLMNFESFGINNNTETVFCKSLENNRISNGFIFIKNKENNFIKNCIDAYASDLRNNSYYFSACESINNLINNLRFKPDVMLIENNTKEEKECSNITEYYLSFYFFNVKGEKIMRSRYINYYVDKENTDNLVEFN